MKQDYLRHKNKKLAYLELGKAGGVPILFFHGFPGCSDQALIFHNCLQSHNLHILSADRPGYGETAANDKFDFDEFLHSCLALTEMREWNSFHVVGVSGGAPYARMMSLLFPKQVFSVTTVCGLGILDKTNIGFMKPYEKFGLRFVRAIPNLLSRALIQQILKNIRPEHAYKKILAEASESDRLVLLDPSIKAILDKSFLTATKQGTAGIHFDLLVFARKLERTVGPTSCPLVLFHATDDLVVPIQMSEYLAQLLPHAEFIPVAGEGHFSLPIRRAKLIADKVLLLHQAAAEKLSQKETGP